MPELPNEQFSLLFYLIEGKVSVNEDFILEAGEGLFIEQENPEFKALKESDVVLFVIDKSSSYFEGVCIAGIKRYDIWILQTID